MAPLTGGTSSLTFLVELTGVAPHESPVVLKVAPPGLAPLRNRDVLRQARLQKAVQGAHRALAPDVLFCDPGDYQRAAQALRASVPAALPPVVNHGDYRLGNTLCARDRVNAVIDWEIWPVGDPRIALAWLTFFTDDARHPAVAPGEVAGTPADREIVRAYENALGAAVPDLGWFDALTRYKEAGVTGLLLKRAHKLGRPLAPSMARMRPAPPRLVRESIAILSG